MKQLRWLIGTFFSIGMPFPVLLTDQPHDWWFAFVALASAFIGAGITYGFGGYGVIPRYLGDLEGKLDPKINQTWVMFFVAAIANLFWANLYINYCI